MTENETAFVINGKKYVFTKTKLKNLDAVCDHCKLKDKCSENPQSLCELIGAVDDSTSNFQLAEEISEAQNEQALTEQAAYDEYQERSRVSGDRADQLAWAMIALLAGQLIGGSKYTEFYVLGGSALLYLLLSAMQSVWQSVAIWLVKCRIKRTGITLSDYPDWVGFGAWVFYWLKMVIIAVGAIYGASHFISFAI